MRNLFNLLLGILLFYFIASLFAVILQFDGGNSFDNIFLPSLMFGILVAALPAILSFFKIRETTGALLLGGFVVNFLFYFVGYYLIKFFDIVNGRVVFGFDFISINVNDKTLGLILISLVSAGLSVILQILADRK